MSLERIKIDNEVALAHKDKRRSIYGPSQVLGGLEGDWFSHNIIVLNENPQPLGDHYHDYHEVFWTPTGEFYFAFVDLDSREFSEFRLHEDSRIFIPPRFAHRVIGKSGSILMGYGNARFNPQKLINCDKEILDLLGQSHIQPTDL